MYISEFQIENYKSYQQSETIKLTQGFNVIVGQNNAGKTAFIEALSLRLNHVPHLSITTRPEPGIRLNDNLSRVHITFRFTAHEVKRLLVNTYSDFFIPYWMGQQTQERAAELFLRHIHKEEDLLRCTYRPNDFTNAYLGSIGEHSDATHVVQLRGNTSEQCLEAVGQVLSKEQVSAGNLYGHLLAGLSRDRIYLFKAERLNVSQSPFGAGKLLSSNAANLAQVLNALQTSNPGQYQRIIDRIKTIFPEIKDVTVPAIGSNDVRILIWSIDSNSERDDLAIPLADSGTGIGQVLAILYVVLTANQPQTIIIDEPQSFLNPGAVRKLLEILKQYTRHQFIITTHSPEVISIASPCTLFLLQKKDFETRITQLNSSNMKDQELLLLAIGARLSDVFGADNILWVEGATEEKSYPHIIEHLLKRQLRGTKILGVVETGDFEGRQSKLVWKVYARLTQGKGLIPPAIGFIFDRDGRTQQQQEDLVRESKDRVTFLPRQMYENYLLNPEAIAYVMSQVEGFRENPVTSKEVEEKLQCSSRESIYSTKDEWLTEAHGANILKSLFKDFSEGRVEYDKVAYGVALTEWIVKHAPDNLKEVAEIITSKLSE